MDLLDVSRSNGYWAYEGSMIQFRGVPGLEDYSGWIVVETLSYRQWNRELHRGLPGWIYKKGMTFEM